MRSQKMTSNKDKEGENKKKHVEKMFSDFPHLFTHNYSEADSEKE
jgi:hypothetical protein